VKLTYLSLGSNLGDRESNLQSALDQLAAPDLHIRRVSSIYETEPLEYTGQHWFLNLVAEAETDLFPMQLLWRVNKIERALGRIRAIPKGPRTLDIDIVLYANAVVHSQALEIPHPRMAERRFVLAPLAELAPNLRHPVNCRTIRELLDAAPQQAIKRL
jgi:2-amino-4-hydroxy-6-hydroxymethyldihydropteridine diphosphokinase